MGKGHELRWGGLAGLGAVVLAIVARVVLGSRVPVITDSPSTIAAFLSDHRGQILAAALLCAVAVALLLWFGAALATAFRRTDPDSDAPAVVLAGFTLVCAIGLFALSMLGGMTYAMTAHRELLSLAAGPYTALTVAGTIAGIAVALPLAAAAVAIARTQVFPQWMAWFAGLVALARVLAAFAAPNTAGVFTPGGTVISYVPGVLTGLWILAASWLLVREHLPVISVPTAPAVGHA
ncbi:MAG: hypothetical protein ACRDS0_06760 [Pseudonocardiaceae bacterium]